MGSQPQALIVDDGELRDVRDALQSLGIGFAEAAGAEPDPQLEVMLLVTSTARAQRMANGNARRPRHHLHLVVSDAHEQAVESVPCDFLMRRPVSKDVLRLLVERARYVGPERRRMTRVALGTPILLRHDGVEQQAILAQISVGGCGLVTSFPLAADASVRLELPRDLTGPRHLSLTGRVISSRDATTADGATFDVSIAFDSLKLSDRVTLRALMAGQPIDFRPHVASSAGSVAPRRGSRRRPVAGRKGVARVVIGRDVSALGMRIELDPHVEPGAPLELAVYGGTGSSQAVRVRGRAERDPMVEAWQVRFEGVDAATARKLEALCAAEGSGFVIAEILEHR
jgi:hypothetical protein